MALHLNLNHELEKEKAVRARDPLKLSMMAIGLVIAGFAAQYVWKLGSMASLNHQLSGKKAELAALTPKAEEAVKLEAELQKKLANSEKFGKRIESRFYWAPFLQEVYKTVPANVQITRLAGDASGEALKKVQINIDGIAGGAEPRKVSEDFRTKLRDVLGKNYKNVTATFRHLEDANELVQVDGKSVPTASFAINLQMQSGEEAQAAPAPRAVKRH